MKKMKDKTFAFRISSSDLERIRSKAKRARMTVTDYLVASALNHPITVIDGVEEMAKELKAIGRNINQLTTLAHMGKYTGGGIQDCTEAFGNIYAALESLIREVA